MILLKDYTDYFELVAKGLFGHTPQKPTFFSASVAEIENGSIRALREGSRTKLDTSRPLLFSQDFEGKLGDNRASNMRDYKVGAFGVLVRSKPDDRKAEIAAYDLAQIQARKVLKYMYADWQKAMNSGADAYSFVRGFKLDTISYSQLHYEFDANFVGWLYSFQIHDRFNF